MPPPRSDLIFPLTQVLDISWNNFGAADACAALSQVGGAAVRRDAVRRRPEGDCV
jgi:hypothetical protein